jgi:hypothetical protein
MTEANGGNMLSLKMMIAASLICLALAGCGTGTPIVAGAVDTVGVAIGGGTQEQGVNLTVGYKGAKFAVVPVQTSQGQLLALTDGANRDKGFSVFAMLGLDAKGAPVGTGVEQVLAVGPAAEIWAKRARVVVP